MKIENAKMRGFYAGLIAGALGGFIFTIGRIIADIFRFYTGTPTLLEFDMMMIHFGYAMGANGIFGAIFGIIYPLFYDRVPSKGIKKSLIFGLMMFFFSNVFISSIYLLNWYLTGFEQFFLDSFAWVFYGIQIWFPYGIFLGLLYERWK